jgi:hypothetical protein
MLRAETYSPGPGATLGPMLADIDAPGELVKELGVHNRADILLNYHAQLYPPDLVQKLALPRDLGRTAALDLEEVHDALASLKGRRAFFDPEKDTLNDASVKGDPATGLYVSVLYMVPSGRTARGVIPYELCPASARAYDQLLQDEAQVGALTSGLRARRPHQAGSADGADQAHEDQLRQLERRVSDSEAAQTAVTEELSRLRDPEPWKGYDEENGDPIRAKIEDGGAAEYGRSGLERIRDYEERHKARKGVLNAVEAALAAQRG